MTLNVLNGALFSPAFDEFAIDSLVVESATGFVPTRTITPTAESVRTIPVSTPLPPCPTAHCSGLNSTDSARTPCEPDSNPLLDRDRSFHASYSGAS